MNLMASSIKDVEKNEFNILLAHNVYTFLIVIKLIFNILTIPKFFKSMYKFLKMLFSNYFAWFCKFLNILVLHLFIYNIQI
jgi:hypothetical protein